MPASEGANSAQGWALGDPLSGRFAAEQEPRVRDVLSLGHLGCLQLVADQTFSRALLGIVVLGCLLT